VKKYKVKGIVVDSDNRTSPYGQDIETELTKILSEQLAKEIDIEILKSLGILEKPMRRKNSINKIYKNVC
jgi:hypothetical protein